MGPASDIAASVPRRVARGVAELERRGFRVRIGDHVERPSGREGKLGDLHALFEDDDVDAVVCTTGGADSHQLLDEIDYSMIGAHPKIFCGHSDITALQAAIWVRTGLVTFMGPSLLSDRAEFGGLPAYTWTEWEATAMRAKPRGEVGVAPEWSSEFTEWDQSDDQSRQWAPNPGPRTVRAGAAEGPLVPANLSTLLLLSGTPWWPGSHGRGHRDRGGRRGAGMVGRAIAPPAATGRRLGKGRGPRSRQVPSAIRNRAAGARSASA